MTKLANRISDKLSEKAPKFKGSKDKPEIVKALNQAQSRLKSMENSSNRDKVKKALSAIDKAFKEVDKLN